MYISNVCSPSGTLFYAPVKLCFVLLFAFISSSLFLINVIYLLLYKSCSKSIFREVHSFLHLYHDFFVHKDHFPFLINYFSYTYRILFFVSTPDAVPLIREERASVSSLSSKEDLESAPSKEDLESDAEVRQINKRERQKKDSVVHQFPSK